jgi:hypothetical protein
MLEVQAGLLGRRSLLVPVTDIDEIVAEEKRIVLRSTPHLVGSLPRSA